MIGHAFAIRSLKIRQEKPKYSNAQIYKISIITYFAKDKKKYIKLIAIENTSHTDKRSLKKGMVI